FVFDPNSGEVIPTVVPREDDFPFLSASLVGDSTISSEWGPVTGRRWRLQAFYAPDFDDSGTLTSSLSVDARQYVPISRRSGLALRLFAGYSSGNAPNIFYFGGLDDFRASRFREFAGDRVFHANIEYRFPLLDSAALFGGLP